MIIKKNILFGTTGLGILTASVVTPAVLLNSEENKQSFNLLRNSNIWQGAGGTVFQDQFKNLWAMGYNSKLQVLKANQNKDGYDKSTGWTNDVLNENLLKGSNINDGWGGVIFQDSFKNLWAMSDSITKDVNGVKKTIHTKLQVLKANQNKDGYVTTGWTNDVLKESLLKGSNITNGFEGTIFQDQFKNLWAMGKDSKLQVLKANQNKDGYVTTGWTNDVLNEGLLKGSNINYGQAGAIFQDQFKNLWAMGANSKLQVLKANEDKDGYVSSWTDDNSVDGLLKDSNTEYGAWGKIFQDQFKNLWIVGNGERFQVLKANEDKNGYVSSWTDDNSVDGLLKNADTNYGDNGTIFQDKFGNLWVTGLNQKLQVLKVNEDKNGYVSSWTDDNSVDGLLKNSNINNGIGAIIFQDQFKNLWAMSEVGNTQKLQVLKANKDKNGYVSSWTDDNSVDGLLKNSIIKNGWKGTIYQDQFKNLWAMGTNSKLQLLKVNEDKNGYETSWINNNGLKQTKKISKITEKI